MNRRIFELISFTLEEKEEEEGEGKVNREASRMERSRVGKWRFVTPGKLVARNLEIAKWWKKAEKGERKEEEGGRKKEEEENRRRSLSVGTCD